MSLRCPECKVATLNTPSIIVRLEKRTKMNVPIKLCRRCKILMLLEKTKLNGWKIWNGREYIDYDPKKF